MVSDFNRWPTDPDATGAESSDELVGIPAEAGRSIFCARCIAPHKLSATANLLFYRCGLGWFLAGVDGRLLRHLILAPRDLLD